MTVISPTTGINTITRLSTDASLRQARELDNAPTTRGLAAERAASDRRRAEEVKAAYTEFVGKTFFSQLLKAMRSTQGEPAYFHGGRSEEVFRGQLDQALVDTMTVASAERFAEPMFEHQFPRLAATLQAAAQDEPENRFDELQGLRRR